MLNEPLFRALNEVFGGNVKVVSEGQEATISVPEIKTSVQRCLASKGQIRPKLEQGGEQYAVPCPFCNDHGQHLYISHVYMQKVDCGQFKSYVHCCPIICFRKNCMEKTENRKELYRLISRKFGAHADQTLKVQSTTNAKTYWDNLKVTMPLSIPLLDSAEWLLDVIRGRGLDPKRVSDVYGCRVGLVPIYREWPVFIFPVYHNSTLRMWQARFSGKSEMLKLPNGKKLPKYFTAAGMKKSKCLYNIDVAAFKRDVILTEGIFDVMKAGPNAVAMFGKVPSTYQEQLLVSYWGTGRLIWMPDMDDPDALPKAEEKVREYNERKLFKGGAHVVKLPSGDPGDYSEESICSLIQEQTKASLM